MKKQDRTNPNDPQERLRRLGLHGLLTRWAEIANEPWLERLLAIEEQERMKRSLERRIRTARIGAFKNMADFDWTWPKTIEREAVEELFGFGFADEGVNAILLGPNGVGKTMILRNLAHQAVLRGHTVCFTTASDMLADLADLASRDTSHALNRRLRRYTKPKILCVDEVGYLSYDNRYTDLFFEVVSRRYDGPVSIVLSTNKPFGEWSTVFLHAACVVTLVDRLLHRAEVLSIEGDSYRLKEAKDRTATARARRPRKRDTSPEHAHP
ncbi:ATP-binding protein [Pendulispora rubella]|uniref:ATP-binding protein n=1 Tax=Pendulispora rubella TaxID=2741070 RepID=A0ABZ2LIH9_9BACT